MEQTMGFPRIRGGDPICSTWANLQCLVFPASAGVIPLLRPDSCLPKRFPRIRGGDPLVAAKAEDACRFSPHPRG